jgi:excisionase family DNA binding protein
MDKLLYTIPQCCQITQIGRTKFYEILAAGGLPVRRVGRRTLIAAPDLLKWIESLPPQTLRGARREDNAGMKS